ncbi:winged helix-turn-helix domain-containing protein [Pedobacter boryungensis]|uniref:Winged helix-turn-helix transcriptional regulator n=1 Tax=Pedobacter boryungensis TaxID=869962 RepID=A0ABX2D928_9SPHI|nr:winged helix-turn-helix domain-containing protein [Pedobacter boryungensis]NQX30571.1 winged helix-turn-helix transcriptional regulator [Pedobacter boryungensis]
MFDRQNLLFGKGKYLLGSILFLFIAIACVAFRMEDKDDFEHSRREISLRKIGDELLLQSGDSTSRVLPLKKIADNEYQISFEHDLSFQPEVLVNTIRNLLIKDPLTSDYIVNVLNCKKDSIVYGYAISKDKKDDIVSCIGRKQPKTCYTINIKFKPKGVAIAKNEYFLGGLSFLAFIGFVFLGTTKPKRALLRNDQETGVFTLGSMFFDMKNRILTIHGQPIELTKTESRVLGIFASSPNETIERSRLQKEIWEDEGVIVGRSLDMFISKLRKKLEVDPNIQIVVVRGKGYKLEI